MFLGRLRVPFPISVQVVESPREIKKKKKKKKNPRVPTIETLQTLPLYLGVAIHWLD